jgi:hypothetical protein
MHRSRRRERRSSLSPGASFVFETYEPPIRTLIHMCAYGMYRRARARESVRTHIHRAAIARCVCVVRTDVRSRAPRAWLEKEKNRKSKVPRLVIHRHSASPVRRHYLRFRGRTNFLIRVGAGGKCALAARASSVSPRSRGFLSAEQRE